MGRIVGIDLGTTNSVVAIMDGPKPRILDNREGKPQIRSVVSLRKRRGRPGEGEEILVGDTALANWPAAPQDTVISIKRLMGRSIEDKEVTKVRKWATYQIVEPADGTRDSVRVVMGGRQYSPVDISARILATLKADAELRLGEEVTHAVITVPAYFSQIQNDATRKAGLKAGLQVIKILQEPTAAAIAFGMETGDGTPKTVLVFDLGGGTFDISILMWAGSVFAPLGLEGDMWLGGDNLDQKLVEHVVEYVRSEFKIDPLSDGAFMSQLKTAAQAAKERLSSSRSTGIIMSGLLRDEERNLVDIDVEITREEFERMVLPLVGRYKACRCGQANYAAAAACATCSASLQSTAVEDGKTVALVHKAMRDAHLTPEQIDYVLVAGNASTVPLVQQTLEEMFGREKISRKIHPKHCVALGAAFVATLYGRKVVCQAAAGDPERECGHVNEDGATNCARCGQPLGIGGEAAGSPEVIVDIDPPVGIAPFPYGIQAAGDKFHVFVKKGDPFPTVDPQAQTFFTRAPNQQILNIPVYGGENLEKASANDKQGEALAILPPNLPEGSPVRIKLWLDRDGIFVVTAYLADGRDLKPWVMGGEEDARAILDLQYADRTVAEHRRMGPSERLEEFDRLRDRIIEDLKDAKNHEAAREGGRQIREMAERIGQGKPNLRQVGENLVAHAEFILTQYGWLLDPNTAYGLTAAKEEVKTALASDDASNLESRVNRLLELIDLPKLPQNVQILLTYRMVIATQVRPVDPALASSLLTELDTIERALQAGDATAQQRLSALEKRVVAAIERPPADKCVVGHPVAPGSFWCDQRHPVYVPGARGQMLTTTE